MSAGAIPAIEKALAPEIFAGETVRSGIPLMLRWVCASPVPGPKEVSS